MRSFAHSMRPPSLSAQRALQRRACRAYLQSTSVAARIGRATRCGAPTHGCIDEKRKKERKRNKESTPAIARQWLARKGGGLAAAEKVRQQFLIATPARSTDRHDPSTARASIRTASSLGSPRVYTPRESTGESVFFSFFFSRVRESVE